jgi:multicomponent Na+:H+ antiporter subunit G
VSWLEILGAFFLIQGIAFTALAALGLIRMPDVYNRLHASSKALTFGALGVLFSTVGLSGPELSLRSIMAGVFILITAPIAATAVARAAYRQGAPMTNRTVRDELADPQEQSCPPPKNDCGVKS